MESGDSREKAEEPEVRWYQRACRSCGKMIYLRLEETGWRAYEDPQFQISHVPRCLNGSFNEEAQVRPAVIDSTDQLISETFDIVHEITDVLKKSADETANKLEQVNLTLNEATHLLKEVVAFIKPRDG